MFKPINRKTILFISVLILSFTVFIPTVKSIKDTIYLEEGDRSSAYIIEAIKGDLILWEFRTFNDTFSCGLLISELSFNSYVSWANTADKGIFEVLEYHTFRFRLENMGHTGDGYVEFEIKIIKRIHGYDSFFIFTVISFVSIISILTLKRLRTA